MWCFARFVTICAILKNAKNTHGGVLLLVKLHVEANNVTKSKTPLWVLFTIFKLYKWHWIVENVTCFINVFWLINFGPKFFYRGEGEDKHKSRGNRSKIHNTFNRTSLIYLLLYSCDTFAGSKDLYGGKAIEWNFTHLIQVSRWDAPRWLPQSINLLKLSPRSKIIPPQPINE